MRNLWYVRIFESVVRELAARGHLIHLLAERGEQNDLARDWNEAAAALAAGHPNITFAWAPRRIEDDWIDLRLMIRLGIDHLRFLEPDYEQTPKLAARARMRTPGLIIRLADAPLLRSRLGRRLLAGGLRVAERAMPIDPDVAACIESHGADVILVTPLLTLGSDQQDVVRTARRVGVPTALCVGSWDHLSSKALIRDQPDRVFVWNETQKREAVALHHVPESRVAVTGAQCFDQWFDRQPTLGREAFCRKVGLDPSRPYVLYVCSALFEGSPNEAEFAARWASEIRDSADPAVRNAGILIRPHPKRGFEWDHVDVSGRDNVAIWPPRAVAPMDEPTKSDYFDSMYHSAVVVGLNTSALIEAGIVGRAVHTILLPEFFENQEGTLHFHYLIEGGLLRCARDLPSHVLQLGRSLQEADPRVHHNKVFVEAFVRPKGLAVAAAPGFAESVEELAAMRPRAEADPFWIPLLRTALVPLARHTSGTFAQQVSRERRRRQKRRNKEERVAMLEAARTAQKTQIQEEREARRAAEARQRLEQLEQKRTERAATKERRLQEKRREKNERAAQWKREKRRRALNARLAGYYRRLMRPFMANR
jgi:hypothetical protein